jgi:hypothetical protein
VIGGVIVIGIICELLFKEQKYGIIDIPVLCVSTQDQEQLKVITQASIPQVAVQPTP